MIQSKQCDEILRQNGYTFSEIALNSKILHRIGTWVRFEPLGNKRLDFILQLLTALIPLPSATQDHGAFAQP